VLNFAFHLPRAEPERVLDDAQGPLAAERHQRFRVKLHPAGPAASCARSPSRRRPRCSRSHRAPRHAVALNIQRMISGRSRFHWAGSASAAALTCTRDGRPWRGWPSWLSLPPKYSPIACTPRQTPKIGSFCSSAAPIVPDMRNPPAAPARRQHQQVPFRLAQHVERVHMADHGDRRADLAEVIGQHVHETVVMVDQQHPLAASGRIRRERRQRLRRIAGARPGTAPPP